MNRIIKLVNLNLAIDSGLLSTREVLVKIAPNTGNILINSMLKTKRPGRAKHNRRFLRKRIVAK